MKAKTFEVRDRHTFIPVLAVKLEPSNQGDRYLLARAGYGPSPEAQEKYIQLIRIQGGHGPTTCDPYEWDDRTFFTAHQHLVENFDQLESGAVIDVQFILGETSAPEKSERLT